MQGRNTFGNLVQQINRYPQLQLFLSISESQYNLKKYKITEICAQNALSMYQHIVQKFYKNHEIGDSSTWVENQLRLFIWTVLCYLHMNDKTINEMSQQNWLYFGLIFYIKEQNLFEYQARTLLDSEAKVAKWSQEQDYMLYQIFIHDKNAKWNQIAKSLYLNSDKKFIRPSKQCRERWLNHLDPNKSKNCWTIKQLLALFDHVEEKGKKWALLVRKLNNRRGQHTIKNKYNSIIKKQGKLTPNIIESQLRKQIIFRLNRILQSQNLDQNDQFILGLSPKAKNNHLFEINSVFLNKNAMNGQSQNLKKKFDDFRKKIQKFSCDYTPQLNKPQPQLSPQIQNNSPKNNRMINFLSKLTSTPVPASYTNKDAIKQLQQNDKNRQNEYMDKYNNNQSEDNIFYDDSYHDQSNILTMGYRNNQILLVEQINNFINQSQLEI